MPAECYCEHNTWLRDEPKADKITSCYTQVSQPVWTYTGCISLAEDPEDPEAAIDILAALSMRLDSPKIAHPRTRTVETGKSVTRQFRADAGVDSTLKQ